MSESQKHLIKRHLFKASKNTGEVCIEILDDGKPCWLYRANALHAKPWELFARWMANEEQELENLKADEEI